MATTTSSLAAWTQTNETLTQDLQSVLAFLATAPWSADPASPYVVAEAQQARLTAAIHQHAVAGVRQINDEIAAGPLIAEINALSAKAKQEAALLANAVKTVTGITKAVDLAAGVVSQFNKLPFL
jgi:hypothetical protein